MRHYLRFSLIFSVLNISIACRTYFDDNIESMVGLTRFKAVLFRRYIASLSDSILCTLRLFTQHRSLGFSLKPLQLVIRLTGNKTTRTVLSPTLSVSADVPFPDIPFRCIVSTSGFVNLESVL